MFESKKELRKHIKTIFRAKTSTELEIESRIILSRLEQSDEFMSARTVALYYSLEDEPATHAFIERWAETKIILLPVLRGDKMLFTPYINNKDLSEGDFSIMEPTLVSDESVSDIDLVVVPAVAYDNSGNRLGRGKGYYDKFFGEYPSLMRLGLCFSYALVDSVPALEHDIRVHRVITSL